MPRFDRSTSNGAIGVAPSSRRASLVSRLVVGALCRLLLEYGAKCNLRDC